MTISRRSWMKFVGDLRTINDTAADLVSKKLSSLLPIDTDAKITELLDYCYAAATKYGEAATELAAQMYDACAAASGVVLPAAEPAATASYGEVAKAVRGTMKTTQSPEAIGAAVGRVVKMAGVDTTMRNAIRDGAEWAWIPNGMTCAFCIMLASNGWQRASKKALKGGHAEHIHANCDCTYSIRFDSRSDVEGYDPDRYIEMYNYQLDESGNVLLDENGDPVPRTGRWTKKLNGMRQDFYAQTKATVDNSAFSDETKSEILESSAAEEVFVT